MIDKSTPLVTYIVPSFNHGEFIEECLYSILNDGYENKELLVVDDGSTDNSKEIINKWIKINYNDIKVHLFIQGNQGISKTLNLMIQQSKGEYIRFIASDDLVIKKSTYKLLEEFIKNKDLGCVFGDCKIIDKNSSNVYESSLKNFYKVSFKNYQDKKKLKKEIILNWSVCGPSSMYKKNIFTKVGNFDESLIVEDWDMFIRLVKINSLGFTPVTVASYRFHENNTSRFNSVNRRIEVLRHIKKTILNNITNEMNYENKLLSIKINHVEAKIFYLNRKYFKGGFKFIKYLILKTFI
jgi:glycosyltransferase involved in cell wall biosynthesis